MKLEKKPPALDANDDVSALIETLLATEHRLEELTGGEVDTVAGRDGRTFLLRRAQEELRFSEAARHAAILDALPAHIALLDNQGMIISVNEAWRRFAIANVFHAPGHGVGLNYLEVCEQARGDFSSEARQVATGVRAVLGGAEASWSIEYPCHSATAQRWFLLTVTPLARDRQNGAVVMHLNITERRQAETAAIRLAAIVESSGDAIIGKNLESIITSWNKGAELLFGHAAAEMVGTSIMRLLPTGRPDDHQHILARIKRGENVAPFETVRQTKAGKLVDISVTASPIRDATSKVVGVSIVARDITERKRSEQVIARGLQRLNEAQRIGQIGDWEWDIATQVITWSPQVFEIFGRDPRLGPPHDYEAMTALFDAASTALMTERINRAIESGEAQDYELRAHRPNGTPIDILGRAVPRKDESGKVVGLVGTVQDITAHKRSEESLRVSEERFRLLAKATSDAIWDWDLVTNALWWNEGYEKLFGYERATSNPTVKTWTDHIHPEDLTRVTEGIHHAMEQGDESWTDEYRFQCHDGRYAWVQDRGHIIRDAAGQTIRMIGGMTDQTGRKQAEAELEQAHQELVKASRQAGMAEVATGILHNVGNVLNSVNIASSCVAESIRKSKSANLSKVVTMLREHEADLGAFLTVNPQGRQIPGYLAQLTEHLAGEQTAALKELAHLQKNIEHTKDIVAMQQGFAKVSGATELHSVADLVEDALKINASALARHDIQVRREFEEVPLVLVEKHQVLQILVNLVRNAMQACDEANPLAKQITLRVTRGNDGVRMAVTDNGIGISAENLTRLFTHGFTTKPSGHGFGLHSAALAARKMGGALTVHSDGPGQGATFTLELPYPTRENTHE